MRRAFAALALPLALAACAEPKWAPDADVQRAAYVSPEPPSITLYTAIRNSNGEGGHSAILVNSGQRVMFDPAGTWWHRNAPERNDVIFGMTPQMLDFYIDYHARETYHVVEQKIYVSPEVAALAMAKVQANGAVPKAMCGASVSNILNDLPGFESIPQTYFPAKIMRAYARLPNVQTRKFYDDDSDDNSGLLVAQTAGSAPVPVTQGMIR
jgi:hypothetical protein